MAEVAANEAAVADIPAKVQRAGGSFRLVKRRRKALIGLKMLPGTAITSRPCSSAKSAVIRAPLRSPASTMTVPVDRPEIMRLRRGKLTASGGTPGANSLVMSATWVPWPMPTRRTLAPPGPTGAVKHGFFTDWGVTPPATGADQTYAFGSAQLTKRAQDDAAAFLLGGVNPKADVTPDLSPLQQF